jgi:4-amino-4-deoxy-L-arabinose transferase-like glycosyltransferase
LRVSNFSHPRDLALVGLTLLLLAVLGLDRGLWTPDEPREAEIAREMLLTPSIIPTLDGVAFIEKPPLYYWVVAGAYRLAGTPSALTARLVSVIAGVATLMLVFVWAARGHSTLAGVLAALMLATSLQFTVSTHWVLLDPLLMLFTTLAAWSAWRLLAGEESWRPRALLYAALVLALWTKGLIGPALIIVGLIGYWLVERPRQWRNLHPLRLVGVLVLALAALGAAIGWQGGRAALYEWGWVNHVQRLINPLGRTGHRQPLLYYTWTLPYALLPWIMPLIDALRPRHWRVAVMSSLARFAALMSAAMLLLLSVSATKRETYLLPLLPLIFVWLGVHVATRWQTWRQDAAGLGALWWAQLVLLVLFMFAAPLATCIWLRRIEPLPALLLLAALIAATALLHAGWHAQRARAGAWALTCAVLATASVLALAPGVLDGVKNMAPFIAGVGHELPPGLPVYATSSDETLQAIVPFVTARRLITVDPLQLAAQSAQSTPQWLLVQDNHAAQSPLPSWYRIERSQSFGSGRQLQLWRRQ